MQSTNKEFSENWNFHIVPTPEPMRDLFILFSRAKLMCLKIGKLVR